MDSSTFSRCVNWSIAAGGNGKGLAGGVNKGRSMPSFLPENGCLLCDNMVKAASRCLLGYMKPRNSVRFSTERSF